MNKTTPYSQIIRSVLEKYSDTKAENAPTLTNKIIIDLQSKDFMLLVMGWQNKRYQHHIVFHIEIKDNKVWVHQDTTNVGIAYELETAGIPRGEMVLSFLPAYAQGVQGFAIA